MNFLSLEGKKILIFGKGRFSESILTALQEAGATLSHITWGLESEQIGEKYGIPSRIVNPSSESEIEGAIQKAIAELGDVDVLVNETMSESYRPFSDISLQEWQRSMDNNLIPPFLSTRAVSRHFLVKKKGKIINLVSALGDRGVAGGVAFGTAMGGLIQMTKSLGVEWAGEGIRVNGIGVGWFEGDAANEKVTRLIPLGRVGESWEVGPLVLYLALDASDYVTGQIFYVDGGIMVRP
ncbi:MAG: SDR family oxidoreductase [Syntrophales bacterium]|nr:SDR family oxidoreductase [Syntrophales bacterium]